MPSNQSITFMMIKGSSNVFIAVDQPTRDKLRRRGWQRVTKTQAARTLGSHIGLTAAIARCGSGELERISRFGAIGFVCHGEGAAE